jgi:hypothetical protein
MLSFLITLTTLATNTSAKEIKFKALCLNQAELELGIRDAKGKIETIKVYAHTLSSEKTVLSHEGKISLLSAEKSLSGKVNWNPFVATEVPAALSSIILIISGDETTPKATIVSDPPERAQGGSLRFLNTCPYAVGINLPGLKKILASGTETFCRPSLDHETYVQSQFFTSNLGGGWRAAGGVRWLHLNDIRTLWFITPDPQNPNLVTVHGIEEKVFSPTLTASLKVNPKGIVSQAGR